MTDAFYVPLGGHRYRATPATEGPWSPQFQHGSPPTALLVHAMEQAVPPGEALLSRITAEFVSPVPVGELSTTARVVRDGRNGQLLEAELHSGDRTVMRARAWRLRRTPQDGLPTVGQTPPPPFPEASLPTPASMDFGYAHAMEWRLVAGTVDGPGPATVWSRLRVAVVAGVEPSPVQRVAASADSGSGASAVLDWRRWSFANVDLTVHLTRPPHDEWVCLDAETRIDPGGIGMATTSLADRRGGIGAVAQSLMVAPR